MLLALLASLTACGGGETSANDSPAAVQSDASTLSPMAALGARIFTDASLSSSGRVSCASCHGADRGGSAPNALPAQFGGTLLDRQGLRSSPSIRYLTANRAFAFAADGTPIGGFFWDGRAATLADQARSPLLGPDEMGNASAAEVAAKIGLASYAAEFKALFGADILDRPDDALDRITLAIQQFEREDTGLRPFSSKYDAFLRGQVRLAGNELRGLALFNRADKGNCQACHPSAKSADGSHPLFTDFSYDNLGVPRNPELQRNADPQFFDLGLCARPDGALAARTDLCGAFKVPTLRNVALRGSLFHNGRFKTLKEALTFYVQRDTDPAKFYPLDASGSPMKFDDLPPQYRANVNTSESPYNRRPGDAPALTDAEIDDVIAFLQTLTDGASTSP